MKPYDVMPCWRKTRESVKPADTLGSTSASSTWSRTTSSMMPNSSVAMGDEGVLDANTVSTRTFGSPMMSRISCVNAA